ncbi:MAG: hypothetical protein J0H56_07225 [Micrococcales bacterium]|nr:hypothetical protein [Micrococcales bacterium]
MAGKKPKAPQTGAAATVSSASAPAESSQKENQAQKKTPWFRFTVMILFGIVYAWNLFSAFTNFFGVLDKLSSINQVRSQNSFTLVDTPWFPLIVNLALPVIVFVLALWISRRRSVGILAVMLLTGLGVVAAVNLSLIAYVQAVVPPF